MARSRRKTRPKVIPYKGISFKVCTKCNRQKPCSDYGVRKYQSTGQASVCKQCVATLARLYNSSPDKKEKRKLINRKASLKFLYGLTLQDVEQIKENQNFICPICLKPPNKWCVDHCHKTGKVRGLLCYSCNSLLGHIENEDKMLRIRGYLGTI